MSVRGKFARGDFEIPFSSKTESRNLEKNGPQRGASHLRALQRGVAGDAPGCARPLTSTSRRNLEISKKIELPGRFRLYEISQNLEMAENVEIAHLSFI